MCCEDSLLCLRGMFGCVPPPANASLIFVCACLRRDCNANQSQTRGFRTGTALYIS